MALGVKKPDQTGLPNTSDGHEGPPSLETQDRDMAENILHFTFRVRKGWWWAEQALHCSKHEM